VYTRRYGNMTTPSGPQQQLKNYRGGK